MSACPFRAKKLHAHGSALSDPPGPATGLPQSVQRVAGLVENDGGKVQQIESGLHQLGMADHDLDSVFDLSGVPSFALGSIHARAQDCCAQPFLTQDSLQPGCDVVFLRVHGKDLAPPPLEQFLPDLLNEFSFFRIDPVLGKVTGFRNHESHPALQFRIEFRSVQRSNLVRMIGIEQQSVEHRAQNRPIAPVGFQRLPHVLF